LDQNSNNQLIQLYITILVNPSLSKKELENLGDTFSIILNNSRPEILIEIINYINKEISSMPLGSVNGVISILSSIIQSPSLTQNFFISALDGILPILLSIVQNLYVEYEKLNIEQNLENYLKFNNMFMNAFELLFQCNFKSSKRFKIKDKNISNKFNNLFILEQNC
jgi:superfamily I DNA/RNA helicase